MCGSMKYTCTYPSSKGGHRVFQAFKGKYEVKMEFAKGLGSFNHQRNNVMYLKQRIKLIGTLYFKSLGKLYFLVLAKIGDLGWNWEREVKGDNSVGVWPSTVAGYDSLRQYKWDIKTNFSANCQSCLAHEPSCWSKQHLMFELRLVLQLKSESLINK